VQCLYSLLIRIMLEIRILRDQNCSTTMKPTLMGGLTSWTTVLLVKLTVSQQVKFPHVTEPKGSLPLFKMPTTCPYSDPYQSSPCPQIPLPEYPSLYPPIYSWVFQELPFTQVSSTKPCIQLLYTCNMPCPSYSRFDHLNNI